MTAMDNATRNAGDMINKLTITYNRTRQAHDHQGTDRDHLRRRSALRTGAATRQGSSDMAPEQKKPLRRGRRLRQQGCRPHHPGHRRRRRREFDGDLPAILNALETRITAATASCSKWRSISAKHRAHHRHGLDRRSGPRPGSDRHRRADHRCRSARARSAASSTSSASRSTSAARSAPRSRPIHAPRRVRRAVDRSADPRHRHQGRRPARPYAKGGKIGLFGGAGVGKTVLIRN
jgi:hypothetical protein